MKQHRARDCSIFYKGVVPELAITKYGKRPGMEDLKEFFCNKVLQLNSGSRSFCEYENYFMHGNADGYVYFRCASEDEFTEVTETEILKSILEKEYNYIYINNVKMNKGRVYTERYKDFLEIAEQNRILQELCSSSTKLQNSALEQIKEYFYRVKSGTYKDKSGQEEKDFSQIVMQIAVKCVQIRKFKEETIECIM